MSRQRQWRTGTPARLDQNRILWILPLTFFIAHFTRHLSGGAPQNILWLCNISNLVLAAGLFFRTPILIRIATMWLIPGVPLWLFDMSRTGDSPVSTFLSHLGGLTVGLFALSKIRADRNMWIYAWLYGFFVQLICRLFTPPELNVNVAFQPYYGFDRLFERYWIYWIFNAVVAASVLWILGLILTKIFPPSPGGRASLSFNTIVQRWRARRPAIQ